MIKLHQVIYYLSYAAWKMHLVSPAQIKSQVMNEVSSFLAMIGPLLLLNNYKHSALICRCNEEVFLE